jgi:hypothetical protein
MEITDPRAFHLGNVATRLARNVPLGDAIHNPINAVLCGRRNNPVSADGKVPALACHNPIHYYELPELFMEITSSMTGKSPSTTGAGSEGALTKVTSSKERARAFASMRICCARVRRGAAWCTEADGKWLSQSVRGS